MSEFFAALKWRERLKNEQFACRWGLSKITQKVIDESFWNFEGMSEMAQATSNSILGVIRKESWILDHFEIFVTIAFNGA